MNSTPLVSVVMPVYNAEPYISHAIESILQQSFMDFEFIIIDDGSTDATWQIIQQYAEQDKRIVTIHNSQNMKICQALNSGISLARGKYIARMDADDWSYPNRLQLQYEAMERNPDAVICGSTIEICDEKLRPLNIRRYHLSDKTIRRHFFYYSPFCHPATMFRKDVFNKAGYYNTELYDCEDYELYFRLARYGSLINLPEVLFRLRTHSKSICQQRSRRQEWLVLYVRIKAVFEYGYQMKVSDKIYFLLHLISMFIVPQRLKFRIFNFFRKFAWFKT